MANVNGIEVSGTTYNIEDETARNAATSAAQTATQASDDVSTLQTTVNNISDSVDTIEDDLQTVQDNIGDLADLETTAKANLVAAINEIAQSSGGGINGYLNKSVDPESVGITTAAEEITLMGYSLADMPNNSFVIFIFETLQVNNIRNFSISVITKIGGSYNLENWVSDNFSIFISNNHLGFSNSSEGTTYTARLYKISEGTL